MSFPLDAVPSKTTVGGNPQPDRVPAVVTHKPSRFVRSHGREVSARSAVGAAQNQNGIGRGKPIMLRSIRLVLLLCFSVGVALGQSGGFGDYFICPSAGENLNDVNGSPDLVWIRALLDLDKRPTKSDGVIEGWIDSTVIDETGYCLRAESQCLVVRIALPVADVCYGVIDPKRVHPILASIDGLVVTEKFDGANETIIVPINIEMHFIHVRQPILVSNNHKASHIQTKLIGRWTVECSLLNGELKEINECSGTFSLNSSSHIIDRHVSGKLRLQSFHPCQELVMKGRIVKTLDTDESDDDAIINNEQLSMILLGFEGSRLVKIGKANLAITGDNNSVGRNDNNHGGCCDWESTQQQGHEAYECTEVGW